MSKVRLCAYEFEIIGGLSTEIHTEVEVFGCQYAFGDEGSYKRSPDSSGDLIIPSHYSLYCTFGKLASTNFN